MGSNLVLIGMPGAGKSTIGVLLARQLGFAFLDTDLLIQEQQGKRVLQDVVDEMGQETFRLYEEDLCASLDTVRTVISTGGSVVYFPRAMRRFTELGTVFWLDVPFTEIERRVANFPERGLTIQPGQTLADLQAERAPLYAQYADRRIDCGHREPANIVNEIVAQFQPPQA